MSEGETFNIITDMLNERFGSLWKYDRKTIAPSTVAVDLGLDSLDLVDLLVVVESRFRVDFTDAELEVVRTLQDLCDLVERKARADA